ncbi:hypothetical protein OOT08_18060, partial [Leucobacter sp. M11]|nr:hypothetical protein [Leucobacter sp. M11]
FGEPITAQRAHEIGLLRQVVPAGGAEAAALDAARALAAKPALAMAWTKAAIDAATHAPESASLLIEQLAYAALNRSDAGAMPERTAPERTAPEPRTAPERNQEP